MQYPHGWDGLCGCAGVGRAGWVGGVENGAPELGAGESYGIQTLSGRLMRISFDSFWDRTMDKLRG